MRLSVLSASILRIHIRESSACGGPTRFTACCDTGGLLMARGLQNSNMRNEKPDYVRSSRTRSAWQRGANENTNGLIRRFYPKGTNFSKVSDEQLAVVVHWINNRPRKCLGYRTSHEVVQQALSGALGK